MDENLQRLETELFEALTPVKPHPQFVKSLRQSLVQQMKSVESASLSAQRQVLQNGLLVSGGILGSIVMILAGIRGLMSLIGIVILMVSWIRQDAGDSLASSNS